MVGGRVRRAVGARRRALRAWSWRWRGRSARCTCASGPRGALEIDTEGPPLGEAPPPRPAVLEGGGRAMLGGPGSPRLVLFVSPTCPICEEVKPSVPAAASSAGLAAQLVHDPDAERRWNVPGTPFAVVMDADRGRAGQGDREQPRAARGARRHRGAPDRRGPRSGRRVDRPVRAGRGGGRAPRAADEPPGLPGPASAGAWSRSPAAASWRRRSPGAARRPTTSAGTRSRRAPARIRTRRCRGPTGTASRCTPRTGTRWTTTGALYHDPTTQTPQEDLRADRAGSLRVRAPPALRRRVDALLLGTPASHPGLLLDLGHPHQRRRGGAGLLPAAPEGVLHHVPRAHRHVLSGSRPGPARDRLDRRRDLHAVRPLRPVDGGDHQPRRVRGSDRQVARGGGAARPRARR